MTTITDAAYSNTDEEYREICHFLDELAPRDPFMHWESGRMNFWRYNVHAKKDRTDPFFRDNVHLWRSGGHLVGLAISEYGRNDMFVELDPDYGALLGDMFRWVEAEWARERRTVEIDVFSENLQRIRILRERGYAFVSHFENKRYYDLGTVELSYEIDDGYSVQAFSDAPDYGSRVELVRRAFATTAYSEENLRKLTASPDYVGQYNLSVISPDGAHVAYCVGWNDNSRAAAGYIEPVATHPEYRKRGLARAVIRECFGRMKANGIREVEIASRAEPDPSNFLYDSLGPVLKREIHKYGKAVG